MTERTKRVTTFLNDEEYMMLEKQCEDADMNQSAYLRRMITGGKNGASQPGYTELLQHIADMDNAVFTTAEAAKHNAEIRQEDIERMLLLMDSIWNKVKGCL